MCGAPKRLCRYCDPRPLISLRPFSGGGLSAAVALLRHFCCCGGCRRAAGLTSGKGVASVSSAGRRTPPSWPLPGGRVQPSSDIAVLLLRSTAATRRAPLTLPLLDRLRASAITSAPPPLPLRHTSDGPSIKFCQSPARLTPVRSTCGAYWVRR